MDEDNPLALVLQIITEDLTEIVHLEVQSCPLGDAVAAGNPLNMEVYSKV